MSKAALFIHSSQQKISLPLLGMCLFLIACDQITKFLVYTYLPIMNHSFPYPYGGIGVFQNIGGIEFSITHINNAGAAWGAFNAYPIPLLLVRIGLIIGLCIYFFFFNQKKNWRIPLLLIIAGAIGNVLDYFIYGQVIDMLHFVLWGYDFPVFNIADAAISIGIVSLFFLSFFENKLSNG
jgi:signal peptidase II